jgi:heterotetrameric sarcosine oxidase delta subunit
MTFLVPCPNCGPREATEFSFGGESIRRPPSESSMAELARYLYQRTNARGSQTEWWYHRDGCRRWFLAVRDTATNHVERTFWPGDPGTVGG